MDGFLMTLTSTSTFLNTFTFRFLHPPYKKMYRIEILPSMICLSIVIFPIPLFSQSLPIFDGCCPIHTPHSQTQLAIPDEVANMNFRLCDTISTRTSREMYSAEQINSLPPAMKITCRFHAQFHLS